MDDTKAKPDALRVEMIYILKSRFPLLFRCENVSYMRLSRNDDSNSKILME